jgi:predicted sulfurtransferase
MNTVDEAYSPIHWKISEGTEAESFNELSIKCTKEVVSLDLSDEETRKVKATPGGTHLSAQEFHDMLENSEKDIVLLDVVPELYILSLLFPTE